ncbi:hypothetical protein KP509_26G044100 [Ceratopteris richardii]|uniref:RRM domain-containing protein n=1 Tax=Ceratopteris richardii TaxID=49495 RepID=A0A8T2RK71_CERRI|nr:hypothetical protein KP509_26G044100 [Ceratopteris richardii]
MEEAQHQTVNQAANTSLSSQSSLYVGDLNVSITEHELYELFSRVGHVVSVRVNRNQATNSAYAYVNYTCPEFAQEAHSSLNYTMLHGKQMRIMNVDPDPTQRKSGAANIYVKNLDPLVDNKILHDTFSAYGQILSCRVATNDAGESKGHGYVQFEQEEAASKAIQEANGLLLLEKEIFVGPFMKREERELAASPSKFNNVYVKSFSDATTDADLYRIFGDFGSITSAVVMRDTNGNSKGFGFVNFENADDAVRAVENLNGKFIDGKEWYVGRAQKKSERQLELRERFELNHRDRTEKQKNVNVYVKNLDANVDERVLKDFFSSIGHVVSTKIIRLPDGQSKGIGFVQYSSPDDARKAISEMNGVKLGSKPLFVARAQRKEDRQVKDGIVNGPRINPHHMFHPGAMFGQQYFYGQPLPSIMPHQVYKSTFLFGFCLPMPGIGSARVAVGDLIISQYFKILCSTVMLLTKGLSYDCCLLCTAINRLQASSDIYFAAMLGMQLGLGSAKSLLQIAHVGCL